MAISTPYTYVNGQRLDVNGHNENIYAAPAGQGLMSEINGGLVYEGHTYRKTVLKEHVWPEEVVRARQEGSVRTLDFHSDAFSDTGEATFTPVPAGTVRVYIPYDCSACLWQWSAFVHCWLPYRERYSVEDESFGAAEDKPKAILKAKLDGTFLTHTYRRLPIAVVYSKDTGTNSGRIAVLESRSALQYDMCHLQENVSAGWHELSLNLYMEENRDSDNASGIYEGPLLKMTDADFNPTYEFHNRVSFGVRNTRVLTLL